MQPTRSTASGAPRAEYDKPFLSLLSQLEQLELRGLDCGDPAEALQALHDHGYYRLSAYTYPSRKMLEGAAETEFQYRSSEFNEGARLGDAVALAKFDAKLRNIIFTGIASLEIALRFQLAHVLGQRAPSAHVTREHLDDRACSKPAPSTKRLQHNSMFKYWQHTHSELIKRASGEDYIRHIQQKYHPPVAVWIAVETYDFGALSRLYSLLRRDDQNVIAQRFGIRDGKRFHAWLQGINVLRNHCAHHNRLWNRRIIHSLKEIPAAIVEPTIHHLSSVSDRNKLYPWCAVLAYSLREYDPSSDWHRSLRTIMRKFPQHPLVTPETDMAFPAAWDTLPLWASEPVSAHITVPL